MLWRRERVWFRCSIFYRVTTKEDVRRVGRVRKGGVGVLRSFGYVFCMFNLGVFSY
jgi:hypothetical protein